MTGPEQAGERSSVVILPGFDDKGCRYLTFDTAQYFMEAGLTAHVLDFERRRLPDGGGDLWSAIEDIDPNGIVVVNATLMGDKEVTPAGRLSVWAANVATAPSKTEHGELPIWVRGELRTVSPEAEAYENERGPDDEPSEYAAEIRLREAGAVAITAANLQEIVEVMTSKDRENR